MKNFLLAALSITSLAAAQTRPLLEASGGLTFPDISGQMDIDEQSSWNLRVGGGVAIPMNPQFDALLTGQFAMCKAGGENSEDGETVEVQLVPKFIELDGTAMWKASPRFGILGGLVVSIPMGGTYEMEYTNDEYPRFNSSDDGDIDDLAEDMDADLNTFTSLKLGGAYLLDERKSIHVAYFVPLGKYLDGEGFGVKIARLVAGISFRI